MSNVLRILTEYADPRGEVKFVTVNGESWELKGHCNRCGACCEKTKMSVKEFRTKKGGCKHFSFERVNEEKLGTCAIMWGRPAFCMLYPRDPHEELHEECTYYWERLD